MQPADFERKWLTLSVNFSWNVVLNQMPSMADVKAVLSQARATILASATTPDQSMKFFLYAQELNYDVTVPISPLGFILVEINISSTLREAGYKSGALLKVSGKCENDARSDIVSKFFFALFALWTG